MKCTEILGEDWEIRTGRLTVVASIWGVRKTGRLCVIYKCNKYPEVIFREAPPPQNLLDIDCTSLYNENQRR